MSAATQIRALRRHGGGAELVWKPQARCRLINWLLATGFDAGRGKLRPYCLARRAIEWWLTRYARAQNERARKSNRLIPWKDTEAERRWVLEAALLRLYLGPEAAVTELARLAQAGFGREIRRRLALLRTWDMPREPEGGEVNSEHAMDWRRQAVYLPWRWEDYADRPEILDVLYRLGLGGRALQGEVTGFRPPTRFALAAGALAGLALAALAAAAIKYLNPPSTRFISQEAMMDEPPLQVQSLRHLDQKTGTALIGHAKSVEVITGLPAGAEIPVQWRWAPDQPGEHNNPVEPYPGSSGRLFLGGTLAEPVRPCDARWPRRSLAVVQGRPTDPEPNQANQLAIALLDRGSADLVLVGQDWQRDLAQLPQRHSLLDRLTQLLVFLPPGAEPPGDMDWPGTWALVSADYAEAVKALKFEGLRPLEAMDTLRRLGGEGIIWLHGGPKKDTGTGLTWVSLCPGTFTMGTSNADPKEAVKMKYSNEQPAHRVSLSAFEITATEITNAQYRRFTPDHDSGAAADLPAVYVTWQQATDFCQRIGGGLPTEAQWEYAARAGSRNPWSFGADSNRLGEYVWYSENSNNTPRAVRQKKPSTWGLYDMHGNAWEWVSDFYGDYPETPQLDPTGSSKERSRRVLRGGSFGFSPEFLRSANRFRVGPEDRFYGFRCVRVPARQD